MGGVRLRLQPGSSARVLALWLCAVPLTHPPHPCLCFRFVGRRHHAGRRRRASSGGGADQVALSDEMEGEEDEEQEDEEQEQQEGAAAGRAPRGARAPRPLSRLQPSRCCPPSATH